MSELFRLPGVSDDSWQSALRTAIVNETAKFQGLLYSSSGNSAVHLQLREAERGIRSFFIGIKSIPPRLLPQVRFRIQDQAGTFVITHQVIPPTGLEQEFCAHTGLDLAALHRPVTHAEMYMETLCSGCRTWFWLNRFQPQPHCPDASCYARDELEVRTAPR